jgi:DNA-directed RNA polymerase specialized sigma subunit
MADLTKEDLDKAVAEIEKRLGKPPTREQVRAALACPICKAPGALLADKCQNCGSYQDPESGQWITPEKPKGKTELKGWFYD